MGSRVPEEHLGSLQKRDLAISCSLAQFKALIRLFTLWSCVSQTRDSPSLPRPPASHGFQATCVLVPVQLHGKAGFQHTTTHITGQLLAWLCAQGPLRSGGFPACPVCPGSCRGVPTSSPPSPTNRRTPGPSSLLEPSPKPLKESVPGLPSSATYWASPGTAFLASHRSLCTRGVWSAGAGRCRPKPSPSSLLRLLHPERAGEALGHLGAFLDTREGRPLSGLPRSP